MIEVTEQTYEQVIKSLGQPVLLEFSSSTCGPCHMMRGILAELEGTSSVPIVKVDVDRCPVITRKFGVVNVPSFILLVGGDGRWIRKSGTMTLAQLQAFISQGVP
jgi:thioredoxin 1